MKYLFRNKPSLYIQMLQGPRRLPWTYLPQRGTDDEAARMRKSEQDEKKMQDEYKEELKITETKKKSIMQALRDRYSKYPKKKS